jgi:hypothetical protein
MSYSSSSETWRGFFWRLLFQSWGRGTPTSPPTSTNPPTNIPLSISNTPPTTDRFTEKCPLFSLSLTRHLYLYLSNFFTIPPLSLSHSLKHTKTHSVFFKLSFSRLFYETLIPSQQSLFGCQGGRMGVGGYMTLGHGVCARMYRWSHDQFGMKRSDSIGHNLVLVWAVQKAGPFLIFFT